MKDFRDKLVVRESNDWGFRQFHAIPLKRGFLSVQASKTHYCSPRRTLDDVHLYEEWEIALINEKGKLVAPPRTLPKGIRRLWESGHFSVVAGYVKTGTVQKIIDLLS